ncbi:Multicopper oxidase with three cupredoxin domains (includes cell division protein FtsP and spore coat protein CotA) [Mycobacterium numidiamassiliense]|uniref:Multicopper oxidase with three cupredoxin domains (Includes cell division protein FtsP and spore coat protein CotA) n=1 Tax=Mycobacterium numidiamassiliense TaxID=1841861 RepID=A0A2U3P3H8_9MYCO|nr:multicopper oxidase family protein [Mycobacterium numidiamassiliense]SPM38323.1 Multicopper oxidase with three cupredoxin domains (includes cell division protein FtsP and spore coat protein CotA) [Mycobacterium numidiamassiliense]
MTPVPISRRRALILGGIGAVAATAVAIDSVASHAGSGTERWSPADTGNQLNQPAMVDSKDGRLELELIAAAGVRLAGRDTHALGFNDSSPGPTLRVRPGDELAVRLTNRLDKPTNLHTHGLRVSPLGNSDNPFLRVDPGTSFDYLIQIPPDHPAGTFWYHPHHHGMVADQIFGGLVGALLIDPSPGQAPALDVTADHVLMVTDITLADDGTVAAPSAMDRDRGREGEVVLINGQHCPTIPADPGGMQRWRFINGCVSRVLAIRLQGHQLFQIARDGTYLPAPAPKNEVLLGPGNRVDVLVRPTAPGRYQLSARAYQRGSMGSMTITSGFAGLATMDVSQIPVTQPLTPLPDALPVETPTMGAVTAQRQTIFAMTTGADAGAMGGGMDGANDAGATVFTIDGRTFDSARDDQTVALGAIEEWTVINTTPMAHPFHLHVWPFTVLASSDGTSPIGTPQDVVLVPPQGWVRLRIPFTTFPGRSVYHCHVLDHEDLGMMATVNVHP